MRFRLLVIGRLRHGPLAALSAHYAGRIVPAPEIVELALRQALPVAAVKAREAELILGALPPGTSLVALDQSGVMWPSRSFAERLARWGDAGLREIAFAIGGAEGLGRAVVDRADAVLSLGPMTWPHFLARGMLLEQLYRAQQILAGHPYHRE
ncbi:MAG: 23S rRNA (pseudouridine(1915)-N(3))-methyltransferase RlmH [Stellaceae bacterium]